MAEDLQGKINYEIERCINRLKLLIQFYNDIYLNINSRQKLFRHKHEAESGRTSSVGNDILGFDSSGQVTSF